MDRFSDAGSIPARSMETKSAVQEEAEEPHSEKSGCGFFGEGQEKKKQANS